jgi:hypothetical protein
MMMKKEILLTLRVLISLFLCIKKVPIKIKNIY